MSDRPNCPQLDAILGREYPILNHGFIRVVDYMGGDDAVVQAARVSYGAGTKTVRDDRGLIRYLLSHNHTTPFEMAEIKLHVKMPIFVARQWIRHRTASVNEYSARYSILDKEYYVPSREAIAAQSTSNRQGRGEALGEVEQSEVIQRITSGAEDAYRNYLSLLNSGDDGGSGDPSKLGLTRELARSVLPVSYYTQWYWKVNLHNLMRFLQLRMDKHAQWEIRQYALKIAEIVRLWTPHTYEAFSDYQLGRLELSIAAAAVVRGWLRGELISQEESGLSKREWIELSRSMGRPECED
ncbi:MAG: thymidylate synthase (FAD) [Rhizobiales bacterium 24-66-13]|jgi:thymidylate synthase (FAD)|nr:MAG: thymidylate synthase (FAD) [Rhizobiales bacterium 35-66-30]OYZ82255.1 MAG: thymidylate synthase (FAD) [Rhizobiales bacterium 24-66-13]OZB11098.1 MAG: thymidylate synthase (FAD) [Rhizobiales bacterium 39-66-18]HQS07646.1 FAD-dependent thymidylate synthase [Xanthobacteraceae bacterium]HQS46383.1 FAD-dependent thymidylate synthase [Xanthobacteraceae bacterium]